MRDPISILRMLAVLPGTQMINLSATQMMNKLTTHEGSQRRKWTREDYKLALYCYFRSNPAKRGYRKRMIEIWTEFGRFKATKQRLDEQVRTITKNGLFFDLEIREIHQQIYKPRYQQNPNTITETLNTGKPETPN